MTKKIIIHLISTEKVPWLIATENGDLEKLLAEDDLATIAATSLQYIKSADYSGEYETVVIVPGMDVLLTQVTLPNVQRRGISATIGYALEEQLIEEAEHYYFAAPEKIQANTYFPVAVVLKEKLQTWIDRLKTNNIQAHYLVPEMLAIQYEPHTWHVYIEDDIAVIRTGESSGFVVDRQLLDIVLKDQLKDGGTTDKPEKLLLTNLTKKSPKLTKFPIPVEKLPAKNMLEQTVRLTAFPVNLLQPAQLPKQKTGRTLKIWQAVCYLGIACIAVNVLAIITCYIYLAHQNTALKRQIAAIYLQNFPGATTADDPGTQMQAKLTQLKSAASGGEFLQLLAKSGQVIRQYGIITDLNYENKQLQLDLKINNSANKSALTSALERQNLAVTSEEKAGLLNLTIGETQ